MSYIQFAPIQYSQVFKPEYSPALMGCGLMLEASTMACPICGEEIGVHPVAAKILDRGSYIKGLEYPFIDEYNNRHSWMKKSEIIKSAELDTKLANHLQKVFKLAKQENYVLWNLYSLKVYLNRLIQDEYLDIDINKEELEQLKKCFYGAYDLEELRPYKQVLADLDNKKYERSKVTPKLRSTVLRRDNYTCQHCGRKAPLVPLVVDHIKPISKGGKTTLDNLQALCFECNAGKGNSY